MSFQKEQMFKKFYLPLLVFIIVNSDIVLTLDGEKDIISYKTGMELSFWIYNLTQSTNSLRFLLLNYLIPLRLCEIFIVYDANGMIN